MTWKPLPLEPGDFPSTPVAVALAKVASRLGAASPETQKVVFNTWSECVGSDIESHAQPLSLVDGTLVVTVDDPRWATQLKWMAPQISQRLNEAVGNQAISRIEVRLEVGGSRK